jgi:hypothetical protein
MHRFAFTPARVAGTAGLNRMTVNVSLRCIF